MKGAIVLCLNTHMHARDQEDRGKRGLKDSVQFVREETKQGATKKADRTRRQTCVWERL